MCPFHPCIQQIPPQIIAFDIAVVRENGGGGSPHFPHMRQLEGGSRLDREIYKHTWNVAAGNSVCVSHDNNLHVGISMA
jgi:hypothetical protein